MGQELRCAKKMTNYKVIASRWYNEAEKTSKCSEFMAFSGQYICHEICFKANNKNLDTLLNAIINNPKKTSGDPINKLLNILKPQVEFFKMNVIHNMHPTKLPRDSSQYQLILNNTSSSKKDRLVALLRICKMIRNNTIHGDKDVRNSDDQNKVKHAYRVLKEINHELLYNFC